MKPNVWKKISSVIIILIMMVRNVHTSSGYCPIEIKEKTFKMNDGDNYWLTMNKNEKPAIERKMKYTFCSFQPKDGWEYYLFDMKTKRFICTGKVKTGRNNRAKLAGVVAKRKPKREECLLNEQITETGYSILEGYKSTVELQLNKKGVVGQNDTMMMIENSRNLPEYMENYCILQLQRYCQRINHVVKTHALSFKKKFCNKDCWT